MRRLEYLKFRGVFSALVIVCVVSLFLTDAFATNGYFSLGYGTRYKALGGAGVALSLSSMAPATNPAALAYQGNRVDAGLGIFNPNREYTVNGNPSGFPGTFGLMPVTVRSGKVAFVIPSLAGSVSLPGGHHLGLTIYGNGGMNTNYDNDVFYGTRPTGVDLTQLFVAATYAREIAPGQAVGVSGIFAFQRFKAEGLQAFGMFSSAPSDLTNNGYNNSTGMGAKIGYMGKLLPILSIGASYQTRISMTQFNDYQGLFAEEGSFDIPASWTAGIAVKPLPMLTVAADVQQILYSQVKSIANPMMPNLGMAMMGNAAYLMGREDGPGFGWEDMTVFKIGAQLTPLPGSTLRAGFSTGKQPIPDSEVMFNILAPAVVEQHVTVGITQKVLPMVEVNASLMRAFSNTVSGPNPLEVPGRQTIDITMDQWEGEVGVSISL